MNACAGRESLLQAFADGELDAVHAVEFETHLKTCPACASALNALRTLHDRLGAPELLARPRPALRTNIEAMLRDEAKKAEPKTPWWRQAWPGWASAAAMAALAAFLAIAPLQTATQMADIEGEVTSSHVRSLLANHLIDVETSDRHVVKPWFEGKVDIAPSVPDLASKGFPLTGGRLDYIDKRVVPVIVYTHGAHVINLFVLPHDPDTDEHGLARRDSYTVLRWRAADLDYWAVSDIDPADLEAFHQAFAAAVSL